MRKKEVRQRVGCHGVSLKGPPPAWEAPCAMAEHGLRALVGQRMEQCLEGNKSLHQTANALWWCACFSQNASVLLNPQIVTPPFSNNK